MGSHSRSVRLESLTETNGQSKYSLSKSKIVGSIVQRNYKEDDADSRVLAVTGIF